MYQKFKFDLSGKANLHKVAQGDIENSDIDSNFTFIDTSNLTTSSFHQRLTMFEVLLL